MTSEIRIAEFALQSRSRSGVDSSMRFLNDSAGGAIRARGRKRRYKTRAHTGNAGRVCKTSSQKATREKPLPDARVVRVVTRYDAPFGSMTESPNKQPRKIP